jgi:myo-inositol-1(or 4)-monophosphatase
MSQAVFRIHRLPRHVQAPVTEAVTVALEAGHLLRRRFRTGVSVKMKGRADIVTATDVEAQRLVERRLRRSFPAHGILAEEGLDTTAGTEWRWIVDPLDGTKNFARGIPTFCVSIAAEYCGQVELGVVYDPLHEEMFTAVRGHGAWLNDQPIRVSRVTDLGLAFVATGCPHRVGRYVQSIALTFGRFAARSLGVRDRGAGALDLCYVACGRYDGYWEIDQSPWDIAAGGLIVEEAGGRMSDFRGGRFDIYGGETVASNRRVHDRIVAVLKMPGGTPPRHRPPVRRS